MSLRWSAISLQWSNTDSSTCDLAGLTNLAATVHSQLWLSSQVAWAIRAQFFKKCIGQVHGSFKGHARPG